MKTPKIEYLKAAPYARYWYWRVRAKNGEILCHSEGYKTKRACLKGIAAMQVAILHAPEPVEVTK